MNCQQCEIEIEETNLRRVFLSGGAESHLGACAACRTFRDERLALRRLVGELEQVAAPLDFDFRLRARMASERGARRSRFGWLNFSPTPTSWSLAGCLALAVAASLYFSQPPPGLLAPPSEQTPLVAANLRPQVIDEKPADLPPSTVEVAQSDVELPGKSAPAPRRQTLTAGRVERMPVEVARAEPRVEDSNAPSLLGSPVRYSANDAGVSANTGALIPVQLSVPERPLQVLLTDTSGESRTISVDPVSFGSRDVIGRPAKFTNASLPTHQGAW